MDTVKNTITQLAGSRGRSARRSGGRSGLGSQASGFVGGLLSGGRTSRNRGRRRR